MAKVETIRCPPSGASSQNSGTEFTTGTGILPQQQLDNNNNNSTGAGTGRNFALLTASTTAASSAFEPAPQQAGSGVNNANLTGVSRPAKMKFSAIWDVDKTPTNCVPRLCRLNVTRLEVKPSALLPDLPSAVLLAVKIQGRRRTLRSTEISLQSGYTVDLNMEFSLTYPHFLKRSNHIEIMLQRKKHYKNRTIPGYRTLAIARLDMNEVLQRPMMTVGGGDDGAGGSEGGGQSMLDLCAPVGGSGKFSTEEGDLTSDQRNQQSGQKSTMAPVASLRLTSASEPVRVPTLASKSEDELSSGADEANVVATDSDDILDDDGGRGGGGHRSGGGRIGGASGAEKPKKNFKSMALGQQTKFKQKIVSLLKKMKVSGASSREASGGLVSPTQTKPSATGVGATDYYLEEDYDREAHGKSRKKGRRNSFPPHSATGPGASSSQQKKIEQSLEDLEAEIENWAPQSDDDSEGDGVSLAVTVQPAETTPKPSLRPFFFTDLRLSSEQLPLLIDDQVRSGGGGKKQAANHQKQDQFDGAAASTSTELAPSPPPVNAPGQLPSPSKQTAPNQPSSGQGQLLLQPGVQDGGKNALKTTSTTQPQKQQQPLFELPHHLALSPGIQLEHIFQTSTDMPSHVVLVFDQSLANLARACSSLPDGLNVVCASNLADVDVFFAEITRLLQKFSSKASSSSYSSLLTTTSSPLCQLKLVVCGVSDAFFATVTQSFVERFSSRLPDAASLVRLLPVPLQPGSAVAQLLGAISYNYRAFVEAMQHDSSTGNPTGFLLQVLQDVLLLPGSLKRQLDLFSIPIGECLLTIRDKSSGGSRQVVVPFICDVQVNIVRASIAQSGASGTSGIGAGGTGGATSMVVTYQQPQQITTTNQAPSTMMNQGAVETALISSSAPTNPSSFASSAAMWMNQELPQSQLLPSSSGPPLSVPPASTSSQPPVPFQSSDPLPVLQGASASNLLLEQQQQQPSTNSSSMVTSGSPPNTTTNTAWGVSGTTPIGPHGSSTGTGTLTTVSGTTTTTIVVPSPDVPATTSSTSAAFEVNVDYWLDTSSTSVSSGGVGAIGGAGSVNIGGPGSAATSSSSSVLTSATSISSQLASAASLQQGGQQSTSGSNASGGARTFNLRGSYRQMAVTRSLVHSSDSPVPLLQPNAMTMIMSARDKKIKKIWLTRKSRESLGGGDKSGASTGEKSDSSKGQTVVDGVNRLVCTVKSSSSGHKVIVCVDGVEFTGVKFFQISPVWHSHVKSFPLFTPSSFSTSGTQPQQQLQQYSSSLC